MLSAETASGNYPIESVKTMARIIVAAEKKSPVPDRRLQQGLSVARAVSSATCQLAWQMNAKAIVTSTLTGGAALRLSKCRPTNPILAFTPHPEIERRMSLYWGVTPRRMPLLKNSDDIFKEFAHALTFHKEVKRGDLLVMVAKSPWAGLTINDLIKVHQIE
jgi:pyruvate kinase